ncbi:MAG: OmpA family protein [Hydrogenophaga sp.]|uniref:OmpA family protein n=1 Tax=Hydrogenophaga sp. TaxID=1904254 RepID=UPI00272FEB08|nr:OmpA family protein [Hydrogenophaga sp.]MDP2252018.1 OmpA family protein [Hydrogenophaga sp.]MDZ4123155.1 OmpA family protein [Hydrogenophaga sp.]
MGASQTRWSRLAALLLITGAFLAGCATPTSTRTTVVLLPEEDNTVGAVAVASGSSTQRLDKAFSYTTVNGNNATPSNARTVGRDTVNTAYGDLLKVNALAPRIFVLQFLLDKTELTEESKALVPAMLRLVRARRPARITIFGHADATGTYESNLKLSAGRAEAAADLIRASDPTLKNIDLQYFGDTKPSTGLSALDAKNRRVEILIF